MCRCFFLGLAKTTLGLAVMCVGVLDEFSPLLHEDRHVHVQDNAGIETQVVYFVYFAVNSDLNSSRWLPVVHSYQNSHVTVHSGDIPDEGREVAPVLRVYVLHFPLELVAAHLHLPLQLRLIAEFQGPCGGGLHAERVGS